MRHLSGVACAIAMAGSAAEAQVRVGTPVEVAGVRGDAVASSPAWLMLRTERGIDSIPQASITSWRWRGTSAVPGAKVGAMLGTVTVGLFGLALSGLCEVNCDSAALQGAVIGGAVGAVAGAGAGAILGSLFPVWREGRGTPSVVPLPTPPVRVHVMRGVTSAAGGGMTQAGVQAVRGDTRVGVEMARLESGYTSYVDGTRSFTDVTSHGGQLGLVVERRLIGGLWAAGSVMQRWSREATRTIDVSSYSSPLGPNIATSERDQSGPGASAGFVVRHRLMGDVWLRVDARQHYRPASMRTLAAGIEL